MKKSILNLEGVEVLSKKQMKTVEGAGRPRGCKQWYIRIFGYTLLAHNNDACQNSDGNWDWGGNGNMPT